MKDSKIEWTDHTLNFWWGCMKVSPGCTNCYALALSKRFGHDIWGPAATTDRHRTKGPWKDILSWERQAEKAGIRRRVFCQSMSDFFEEHPQLDEWRAEACETLESLRWLDVQLLTKRPENVRQMVPAGWLEEWPAHIWIGTSVENQEWADKRIPELLRIPAAVRFLSCEPLLGPVDLKKWIPRFIEWANAGGPNECSHGYAAGIPCPSCTPRIHWVIVGGESGPGARPMEDIWAQSIITQCQKAGVPAFMKQMGGTRKPFRSIPDDMMVREFPHAL